MLLLIDHHDSFTYNIAHAFEQLGQSVVVVDSQENFSPLLSHASYLVLGPGPGSPCDALKVWIKSIQIPILGICLGHQLLALCYGGKVERAKAPVHGKADEIFHQGEDLFAQLPSPMRATRYHSLVVTNTGELIPTAHCVDGQIMALKHVSKPIYGVQFHPESILSHGGEVLFANFLKIGSSFSKGKNSLQGNVCALSHCE